MFEMLRAVGGGVPARVAVEGAGLAVLGGPGADAVAAAGRGGLDGHVARVDDGDLGARVDDGDVEHAELARVGLGDRGRVSRGAAGEGEEGHDPAEARVTHGRIGTRGGGRPYRAGAGSPARGHCAGVEAGSVMVNSTRRLRSWHESAFSWQSGCVAP